MALALTALTALTGCDLSEAPPLPPPEPPSIVALYGAAKETILTPFPSDRYTAADAKSPTGRKVQLTQDTTADPSIAAFASVVDELNEMNGFSTTGGVIVSFDGPIDIHGIVTDDKADPPITDPPMDAAEYQKAGAPFLLVDVDPQSPQYGQARGLVPRWWAQAADGYYMTDDYTLVAQPATPLLPGTRYLFVVTSALKAATGGEVKRSDLSEALISGGADDDYGKEVSAGLDELEKSVGVSRDDVVLATAFTTATVIDETLALAKRARSQAAPALVEPWTVETPMAKNDKRVRFRAVYASPEYRKDKPDGKWSIGADGAPVVQKPMGLEVFLAFSDATVSGPRPVVIFAHGLGGTKDGNWGTAERLAPLNAAVIAIDSPEHGSRAADPNQNPVVAAFSFFGVDPDKQTFDIGRARDNFRQMASDQLELTRFVDSLKTLDLLPVGAPDGKPDLDVSHIEYIGHSFGSVQGPTILALAPEIERATWNVGGDGLMTLLRDSGTFSLLVNSLRPAGTPDGALGRFFAMGQAIVDPGDPLNYARFGALGAAPGVVGWKPRDILLQEVVDDSIVPNSTSEALARAAGLQQVNVVRAISGLSAGQAPLTGNLPSGATGGIAQFDTMDHGMPAEHGGLIFSDEAITQYVGFFQSGLAKGHGAIAPPYPGK